MKAREGRSIQDCRETPIKFASYAISYRGGHAHVRIELTTFQELLAYFSGLAIRRSIEQLAAGITRLPFEPYAPVGRQLLTILKRVNERRKAAGLDTLSST
jgi:hypothetical protein